MQRFRSIPLFFSVSRFSSCAPTSISFDWKQPKGRDTGLLMFNSLTKKKEALRLSSDPKTNQPLTWYSCGPTVYDHSHIGHARCYVQQDIALRVLQHLQIDVKYVMGVTDVDDKIINKAITSITKESMKKEETTAIQRIAQPFEASFWEDLEALHVRKPHGITRVSEHMTNIAAMIQRLVSNGFAYEAMDGSVYFDTGRYREMAEHPVPSRSSLSLDELIENTDADADAVPHKKHVADFALWKNSGTASEQMKELGAEWCLKLDGKDILGRPGWHIECSAMCSKIFGDSLDVHAGGIDLLFPHHCNEVAQSQAFFHDSSSSSPPQWPHYFFHIGHLYIKGFKMSKSLKNFITIKEFLKDNSAEEMRWFCLLHHYRANVDFTPDRMEDVRTVQSKLKQFFAESDYLQKKNKKIQFWKSADHKLFSSFHQYRANTRIALQNDFDTPAVVQEMLSFVKQCHVHFQSANELPASLLEQISIDMKSTLTMLGLQGYKEENSSSSLDHSSLSKELPAKLVEQLLESRSAIRSLALEETQKTAKNTLFSLCDDIRNNLLTNGVEIKDRDSEKSSWRWMEPGELEQKEKQSIFATQLKKHQEEMVANPPITAEEFKENWRADTKNFSEWDAEGFPTRDDSGKEISRSRSKKFKKQFDKHCKLIQQYEMLTKK